MNKKLRDFIFNSFVVIFFIATFLLSLYASGYKFDLRFPINFNRILVRTGMISIETEPKNALIYLNGKTQTTPKLELFRKENLRTPAKIKNLLPGSYTLSIEKEGYWPYQEKIEVYSGQTTNLENINLYKSSNPNLKSVSSENYLEEEIIINQDFDLIFLKESKKIINLKDDKERDLSNELENITSNYYKWCQNNYLFINGYFFSPEKIEKDINYNSLIGLADKWFFNENLNRIYFKNNDSLNYFDVSKKTVISLIKNIDFIDYLPENDYIFLIQEYNNDYYLNKYSLKEGKIIETLLLPKNSNYKFNKNNKEYLSIYDENNKSLYLINKNEIEKGFRKIDNIVNWDWLDKKKIAYINNWELIIYDLEKNEKELLNRFSETLENIIVNSEENYIVLNSKQKIKVIDLKNKFNTDILQAEKLHSLVLDKKNNYLYFWSKINDISGVYRIEIK